MIVTCSVATIKGGYYIKVWHLNNGKVWQVWQSISNRQAKIIIQISEL